MNKQQAIGVINQVCQKFVGTIEEHTAVQQAIQVIQTELFPEPTEKVSNKKTK